MGVRGRWALLLALPAAAALLAGPRSVRHCALRATATIEDAEQAKAAPAAKKAPKRKGPAPKASAPSKKASAPSKKAKPKRKGPPQNKKAKVFAPKMVRAGDVVNGTCVSVRGYGAMIALDAWAPRAEHLGDGASPRTALLHISEITTGRVSDVAAEVPIGSRVTAEVVSVDPSKGNRVSVSTKRLVAGYDAAAAAADAALAASPARPGAEGLLDLAATMSLDDLSALVEKRGRRDAAAKTKKKAAPQPKKQKKKAPDAADAPPQASPLSLTSAFSIDSKVKEQQRSEEFELLMRDVIYEAGSLTDVKLLQGRKKRGAFTSPFWTKVFKPTGKPPAPGRDDDQAE